MSLLAALALAAAVPTPPSPPNTWYQNDKPAQPDPSRASRDGFGAMLLVTDDYEGFWKAWDQPDPPQVGTTERAVRGKPVNAMILLIGCRAAADGKCNVRGTIGMTGPDGKPYGPVQEVVFWDRPPAPGRNLMLSPSSLGFELDPGDALGPYRFRAKVTDEVAGVTLAVQQAVTGVEK